MIQRGYPEYFANQVNFIAVLHNRNSIKDVFEFIYKRYQKIPVITELSPHDVEPDKKDIFERMLNDYIQSEEEYRQEESNLLPMPFESDLFKELNNFLQYFSIHFYLSKITNLFNVEEKFFPTSTCLPFSRKMFLTIHDKLLPCETINYKYSLGKVEENVEIDIPEITRQYNAYYDRLKGVCQYCYDYRFCGLCMFYIKDLDKLDTKRFVCDEFCDQKAFQEKMCRVFSFLEKEQIEFSSLLDLEK